MKAGVFGDTHLTSRGPSRRLDLYFDTQIEKINQGLDIFEAEECTHIFQVGDMFESPDISNHVISTLITLLRKREVKIYCCYGQHDISGHSASTLKRSPLKVLESAGVVKILSEEPIELHGWYSSSTDKRYVNVYGASFGEPVPEVNPDDPYNILVTHRMIGDKSLYPGQELIGPRKFLRDYPGYNLVLCGDYHYRFSDTYNGRTIVNPGCLMRKTISKFDITHRPAVVTFDVLSNELKVHELNVKPVNEVFDLTKVEERDNKKLLQFIESLKSSDKSTIDWQRNLLEILKKRQCNQNVCDLIDKALSKVRDI